jgi:glycosyltransferase involved in cell wall biosynthesis
VLQEEKLLDATLSTFPKSIRERYHAELIVSDGGSTDRTLEIASAHADHVVMNHDGHRQTIAEGRHVGAQAAQGKVFIFINGDTVPKDVEMFFETVLAFTRRTGRYARASALACPVHVAPWERLPLDNVFHGLQNSYTRMLNALRIGAGRGECQIVRREVYERVGGYRLSIAAGEDFDLFARIGLVARVRFAKECTVYESPRRFRKFGYLHVLFSWIRNAMSVLITGRSSSDEWEPVR